MPRALVLSKGESNYHCISRCVRRAYLCGEDLVSGKSYNHRKAWIYERLVYISKVFTIDVLGYALMSTHSHTMLRTRPDILEELSDEAVIVRWLKLYPKRKAPAGSKEYHQLIALIMSDTERLKILRKRLVSISWFMKSLNEYVARKANDEDECKGRFWEGRFKCQKLCDQSAVLSCAVYIDLNPIRAELAATPEESIYTSAYERINALKRQRNERQTFEPELWLAPLQNTKNKKGFLGIPLATYLTILDLSGKEIKKGKRGKIPSTLAPILQRIGIIPEHWIETCNFCRKWFSSAIGNSDSLSIFAQQRNRSWVKGSRIARVVFVSQ